MDLIIRWLVYIKALVALSTTFTPSPNSPPASQAGAATPFPPPFSPPKS